MNLTWINDKKCHGNKFIADKAVIDKVMRMFIQEKQRCPKCGKFITNPQERHLCGYNAPVSKDVAAVTILPLYPRVTPVKSREKVI
jgi:ribosomal protein S27AE